MKVLTWQLRGTRKNDDVIQIATIQSTLGTKARRVLKTLPNIPGNIPKSTVKGILTALETYCVHRGRSPEEYNLQNDDPRRSLVWHICQISEEELNIAISSRRSVMNSP